MLLIPNEEDGYSFKNKIKGYHLPFIGYTYTENSLLNDCQSLFDLINSKSDILLNSSNNNINNTNESIIINQLENEKKELLAKLAILQQQQQEPTINLNNNDEINFKLDQSQLMLNASNEQIAQLNLKLFHHLKYSFLYNYLTN